MPLLGLVKFYRPFLMPSLSCRTRFSLCRVYGPPHKRRRGAGLARNYHGDDARAFHNRSCGRYFFQHRLLPSSSSLASPPGGDCTACRGAYAGMRLPPPAVSREFFAFTLDPLPLTLDPFLLTPSVRRVRVPCRFRRRSMVVRGIRSPPSIRSEPRVREALQRCPYRSH